MKAEIQKAALFLTDLVKHCGHTLSPDQASLFRGTLESLLGDHFRHHWFPERPAKGSGYRCIRINHKMDPMLARAAKACGVHDSGVLRNMFPSELTLWIDPWEVSYRIGENGSICVLYEAVAVPDKENFHANSCKGSVRSMDSLILDNRNLNLDHQFTQYVSS
jgi:protein Tob/BTG